MYYHDAMELGNYVVENGKGESQAPATHNVCNAYYHLGKYDACQSYIEKYSNFSYSFVTDNVKRMTGFINGKTRNIDLVIAQIKKYLDDPSSYNLIHAVTELLQLYLNKNDLLAADQLLVYEEQMTESISQPHTTPYKTSRLAYYYQIKGQLLIRKNQEKDAIESLLKVRWNMLNKTFY